MMSHSQRIGILGGTFDPVHIAHLFIAEAARDAYQLDRVLFIPTGDPPHKKTNRLAPGRERIRMLEEAIRDNPAFQVDDMEITRGGTTYTIDTLRELRMKYPGSQLYFIVGGDTLLDLKNWRNFESVAQMCSFIVYQRPGYHNEEMEREALELAKIYRADIHFAEGPNLEISSKYIRSRLVQNQSIRYLVPASVEEYIRKQGLYKGE